MEIFNQLKTNEDYTEANILVVSKTKMNANHVCIGSITNSGEYMRLLYPDNTNMLDSIDINVNDSLTIKYKKREDTTPPHCEDINLYYAKRISTSNKPLLTILNQLNIKIWTGSPEVLYDNKLIWSNSWQSKGYISSTNISDQSVGFWIADKDIVLNNDRYEYTTDNKTYSIKYIGVNEPQDCIYKGTLIRISLARWWKNSAIFEDERCYLQLSEYYPLEEETNILQKIQLSINNKTKITINYYINGKNKIWKDAIAYKILYINENYYVACEVDTNYKFTLFRISKIRAVINSITQSIYDKNILDFINYIQTLFPKYSPNFKEKMIKVIIEIDKDKAVFFDIKKQMPSQKIIERKDNGNLVVSFIVTDKREVEELIKKWIPFIKVLKPSSLDKKIKKDIKKYLD